MCMFEVFEGYIELKKPSESFLELNVSGGDCDIHM